MEYGLRGHEDDHERRDAQLVLNLVLMEYGLRGSNLGRSVCEPFTTKKTAETEKSRENMYL